jgi:hypothetical protein
MLVLICHRCVDASIHPYTHTSIHPYIHTSIHPYMRRVRESVCVCVSVRERDKEPVLCQRSRSVKERVPEELFCALRTHTCIHAYMHTCIHAYMHTYIRYLAALPEETFSVMHSRKMRDYTLSLTGRCISVCMCVCVCVCVCVYIYIYIYIYMKVAPNMAPTAFLVTATYRCPCADSTYRSKTKSSPFVDILSSQRRTLSLHSQ